MTSGRSERKTKETQERSQEWLCHIEGVGRKERKVDPFKRRKGSGHPC
jgi:hypothetical protein